MNPQEILISEIVEREVHRLSLECDTWSIIESIHKQVSELQVFPTKDELFVNVPFWTQHFVRNPSFRIRVWNPKNE